ncbi:MAG TPA: DUF1080 domain-containing protein [Acidobacteriaceae bacterium]|jgi:hypothetical protein|nr:DUF1080 domain-containing protein [Acidobacteriaceae bacterium]
MPDFCSFVAGKGRNAFQAIVALALLITVLPALGQKINPFPANYQQMWTRVAIPPTHPVSNTAQWHIDAATRTIICDGNGGHEWLRFDRELGNFTFRVRWRFTPQPGTPKYNSGVFFRNNKDGTIWHQAQTSLEGGYIFGETPVDGKLTRVNLEKEMTENRVKPAGQWNTYDIRCVGSTCSLAVNGKVVNKIQLSVENGYIGLESEGYPIEFKDMELKQLP